jgi:hypothetical protein
VVLKSELRGQPAASDGVGGERRERAEHRRRRGERTESEALALELVLDRAEDRRGEAERRELDPDRLGRDVGAEARAKLKIVPARVVSYPSRDIDDLAHNEEFWRVIGERSQADLVLAGSLDFDIQDRSGYRTEEYVSPYDGRTYYRQVLVERSGFEYDIVMLVFDGRTGKLLHSDNFKDFKEFEGANADPLAGMFQNLFALEDRIAGVFAQKKVRTSRTLFTD